MKLTANKYSPFAVILLLSGVGFVFSYGHDEGGAENVPVLAVGIPDDITITTPNSLQEMPTGSKHYLTNQKSIALGVTVKPHGKTGDLILSADSGPQNRKGVMTSGTPTPFATVALLENKTNTISASFTSNVKEDPYRVTSNTISIKCDTIGPMLRHAEVINVPATGVTLVVTFDEGDFDKNTVTPSGTFVVVREKKDGGVH